MISDVIFSQYAPAPNEFADLYIVPEGATAFGTLYIAARQGYDIVSVALIPDGLTIDDSQYILYQTTLFGNVPIYLQQLYLGTGDKIRIGSVTGDTSFTFTGEKYT